MFRCRRVCAWAVGVSVFLSAIGPGVRAQEAANPEEIKRMYDETVAQLKAAQDRRAELAAENEALEAQVKDLETRIAATTQQVQLLQADAAVFAEKTFFLRSHYATFQAFLRRYPEVLERWRAYLGSPIAVPSSLQGPLWPLDEDTAGVE